MKEYYQMSRAEAQKTVNGSTHPLSKKGQIKKNQQKYRSECPRRGKEKIYTSDFSGAVQGLSGYYPDCGSHCIRTAGRNRKRHCYSGGYHHERNFGNCSDGKGRTVTSKTV